MYFCEASMDFAKKVLEMSRIHSGPHLQFLPHFLNACCIEMKNNFTWLKLKHINSFCSHVKKTKWLCFNFYLYICGWLVYLQKKNTISLEMMKLRNLFLCGLGEGSVLNWSQKFSKKFKRSGTIWRFFFNSKNPLRWCDCVVGNIIFFISTYHTLKKWFFFFSL